MKKLALSFPRLRRTESTDSLVLADASSLSVEATANSENTSAIGQNACPIERAAIDEVKKWSEIVFGKKEAMDKKVDEILQNPDKGHQLLREIMQNPQSVHKLAGKSICGIEDRARRNALENVDFLYQAVFVLTKSSEIKNGVLSEEQQSGGYERTVKGLEASPAVSYARIRGNEDEDEDSKKLEAIKNDKLLQACDRQLKYLCLKVFKNPTALNEQILDAMVTSAVGDKRYMNNLLRNLKENPEIYYRPDNSAWHSRDKGFKADKKDLEQLPHFVYNYCTVAMFAEKNLRPEHSQQQERDDISQNQASGIVAQDAQHARREHRPTPQQERPRRAESGKMALAM